MHLSDFDYELPPELIAKEPARPRDASRMMVVNPETGECTDSSFLRLPEFLKSSDVLVLNNTRVLKARLYGKLHRLNGGRVDVEVLFVAPADNGSWEVMCRPGKRIRAGDRVLFEEGRLEGTFDKSHGNGFRLLHLNSSEPIESVLERCGHVPLPPYLARSDTPGDSTEYQTVYAKIPGAIAAPTAGLHFSPATFESLGQRGVQVETITLHVGVGTFIPVRTDDPEKHVLKPERFEITTETAVRLNEARAGGRRIVTVGTTTTRALEYVVSKHGRFEPGTGYTDLFILPGYRFRAADAMLTNFHLPKSTLLMLVSAFASQPIILEAYCRAIKLGYRFYSYGDCMLLSQ